MKPEAERLADPSGHDPHPVVRLSRRSVPGAVIAFAAVALALILFLVLNGQRQRGVVVPEATVQGDGFASPPPLSVPTAVTAEALPPPAVIVTTPAPILPIIRTEQPRPAPFSPPVIVPLQPTPFLPSTETTIAPPESIKAPKSAVVYDLGADPTKPSTSSGSSANGNAGRGGAAAGAGSDDSPAQATTMRSRTDVVPIGTMVPIALETPIDTARPGLVRAIASRDTRGFDGRRILIPRGSRFIGEYQADVRSGQNRVLVTWTRVIRPDGVTIRLGSPAADQLGGSGVPGKVNSFFLQRFAGAVLQSALTVGVNLASRPRAGSVVVGIPSGPITTVGQGLIPSDYRPKITVKQGEALNVFVARDLDFSGLAAGQP